MDLKTPLTIGVLAQAAGVSVETVRFYQRKRLLREPPKPYGGIRHYELADVGRLRFIKSAKRLGFSLEDVSELLRLQDGTHCAEAAQLAEQKLSDVRDKLVELSRMETVLAALVEACHASNKEVSCPLIAALQDEAMVK